MLYYLVFSERKILYCRLFQSKIQNLKSKIGTIAILLC
jgi:hypothetical protein